MGDANKLETRYHYQFIHNVFANFFKDTLDYFSEYLYPRFEYTVIATYDKAVEYLEKKSHYNRETDKPMLPALILNPSGDFRVSEEGLQLFRFPNLAPGQITRVFDPIYQDQHVLVTPSFTRVKGEFELLMLLPSFYEYCDLRMFLIQIFGGENRYIYPIWFHSFIILSDELYNYNYSNPYTGIKYKLNWEDAGSSDVLVKTTNQTEHTFPCRIKPRYKMTGLSDGSTRYGGADKLADWRLTATIEYDVEVPSYILLKSDYLVDHITFELRYSSCFTNYENYNVPVNREVVETYWQTGLDSTSDSTISLPDEADSQNQYSLVFKTKYFHTISETEADSTSNYTISLPETITDIRLLWLNSKYGMLNYGDHYRIINNGTAILIIAEKVDFSKDDILELYVYQYV